MSFLIYCFYYNDTNNNNNYLDNNALGNILTQLNNLQENIIKRFDDVDNSLKKQQKQLLVIEKRIEILEIKKEINDI
jgi:hypothetical protein